MTDIPAGIDDVTAPWLAAATGLSITAADHEQIGEGIGVSSALYRTSLEGDDCPASVVVKLPALDEAAVFTSTILRMYIREVKFFDELAPLSPIRVPRGLYGAVDEETSAFVVVMEDMGSKRTVDQIAGMQVADADRAVDELAAWHAAFWGTADQYVSSGAAVSLADEVYPAVLPLVFGEGWEKLDAAMDLAPPIRRVGPGWVAAMPGLLRDLAQDPSTITHGDYRADNIMFDDDGSVILLDFQLTGLGSASYDLAYFITQSLESDVAGAHERRLFDRYVAALVAHGVSERDTERLWDDYRKAALFCLVYPVVASRGMDLTDERQFQLVDNMNTRFARAVDDLALADLLTT